MACDLGFRPSKYYFLSYNSEDADRVSEIARQMSRTGIELWYDNGIKYDENWERTIAAKIYGCQAVVLFFTRGILYKESSFVEGEYKMALTFKRKIYVVLMDEIDDEDVPPFKVLWWTDIKTQQCIKAHAIADPGRIAEEIVSALTRNDTDYMELRFTDAPYVTKRNKLEPCSGKRYVFISYSTKNLEDALAMRGALMNRGVRTWMAPGDIPAGSTYAGVITRAIKGAECLVLLLTDDSQNSKWVDKEVERALTYGKAVIPVALGNITLNDNFEFYLGNQQIVPVRHIDDNNKELLKIIDQIIKLAGSNLDEIIEPASAKPGYASVSQEFENYQIRAQEGDANAQYKLGSIYSTGQNGTVKDDGKALFWYSKAAESGHAFAMYYLAWMYKRGQGVKEDPEKAFYWFEKAAEKGNVYAICNVGDCYQKGYYVKRDFVKAAEWYKKGEHSSVCCLALGELYELGNGVEKDLEKAMHYYEMSEVLGGVGNSPKKAIERVERKIRHMKT